jgi:hypothetical protein
MTLIQPTLRPVQRTILPALEQRGRALELETLLEDGLATRVQRFRCGTALFNDAFPRAGGINVLRVDGDVPPLDPPALMEFVDRLQAGLPQRSVRVVDGDRADELRPTFAAAGWVIRDMTLMTPRRRPDRPVDVSVVRGVAIDDLFEARQATLRREHRDLDSAEQLVAAGALPAEGVELRAYAATVGTEVAAYVVARVAGEVARLTEIDSFARSQGQGLGRAVIWGAVTRLREEGVRLVVAEVEGDTWPKWTFRRLGFDDIGHTHRFVRPWGVDDHAPPPA